MNFLLTEEQLEYRNEIVDFAQKHLCGELSTPEFPQKMWECVAEFGIFGLTVGEEWGGLGEDYLTAALAYEALGFGCENNGFVFAVTNHVWVALNMLDLYGSQHLKATYLKRMIQGELIGAFALTEPEFGSDALGMSTKAVKTDNGYVLNGNKMFISNGPFADVFLVMATVEGMGPQKYTCFVVERDFAGVNTGAPIKKMGLDGCPMSELILQNCEIPGDNILGKPGLGYGIMMSALEWERIYEFAPHVGAMQRVMKKCRDYARERKQFGRSIGEYQGISHKIAQMQVAVETAKLLLYKVAWLKDQGGSAFKEASIFKLYVSENYVKICQDAMQIFGAYGYSCEYGIERELRDAMACTIYSGTSEIQKNTIYSMMTAEGGLE